MRHKTADFRPRAIPAIATPTPEVGVARNFSECRAMIEESFIVPGLKIVATTALKICAI